MAQQDEAKKVPTPTRTPLPVASSIASLDHLLTLLEYHREGLIHARVRENVSWIGADEATVILHWDTSRGAMPSTFSPTLENFIQTQTKTKVRLVWQDTAQGLSQRAEEEKTKAHYHKAVLDHADVQGVLRAFPDATIEDVVPL
jgi:hypothetical protein